MSIFDSFKLMAGEEISKQIKENIGSLNSIQDIARWAGQSGVDSAKALDIVKGIVGNFSSPNIDLQSISTKLFAELKNAGASNLNLEQVTRKVTELLSNKVA